MPEPWLFCISIYVIYVILSHLIPILRPECLTCAAERFGRSKKRSKPRASCSNFARIIFQSLGFYTSFAELWSLKDLSISIFENRKKKKELQYLTSNYHMFPMGFWFHMGVSINGKTPSYYPFLDGDFPLQTIQLLGTPMTMETYQPLLITCFPICLYVYS